MRAKLPASEGFVERDGVKLHYEVYGQGAETMVFLPPWSIVHSRVYKAQLPYFSERFRCIAFDGRGNGKSDRPTDVAAYSLENCIADIARGHGRHGCWQGDPGRTVARGHARLRVGSASSPTRKSRDPGRNSRGDRPRLSTHGPKALHDETRKLRGLGQIQPRRTGSRTTPILPSTSCATSSPSHIRPSRSRTGWNGPARPPAPCW